MAWVGEEAGRETVKGSLEPTEHPHKTSSHGNHPATVTLCGGREGGTDLKLLVHIIVAFVQVLMQQSPFIFDVNVGVKSS